MFITLFLLILHQTESSLYSSQLFVLPMSYRNFTLIGPVAKFSTSLLNLPDMPLWIHQAQGPFFNYIYGTPPENNAVFNLQLEVIATDLQSYNTSQKIYNLEISQGSVYVSFGSSAAFSTAIKHLEAEVKPLWEHHPCPNYFKKASYERFFRKKGFAVDWCSFKLESKWKKFETPESDSFFSYENKPNVQLIKRSEVFVRSYIWDVIYTILIPLTVLMVLWSLLTVVMCFRKADDLDTRSNLFFEQVFRELPSIPNSEQIQMVHHAGMTRARTLIKSVRGVDQKSKDQSPHPSTATATTNMSV